MVLGQGRVDPLRWVWSDSADAGELWALVQGQTGVVIVTAEGTWSPESEDLLATLTDALGEPLAASASPMPVQSGSSNRLGRYATSPSLPPAPTLALPALHCAVFSVAALRAVWTVPPPPGETWPSTLLVLGQRLVDHGWRHVAVPGVGMRWDPSSFDVPTRSGWSPAAVRSMVGPANESLATHQLWAATRERVRLVVDAPCLDGDQHNGTQALVANVTSALAASRPDADVMIAVHRRNLPVVSRSLGPRVTAIARGERVDVDVVYRPYQLLTPSEWPWLQAVGQRLVLGQLDMIGFSNPSYHPSPELFHAVRNLQRHSVRVADGVTFISEFARRHTMIECPDLEIDRCFVVGSGAAPPGRTGSHSSVSDRRFLLCLSSSFSHKHREHSIRTFAVMVDAHGFDGELRIAGPSPYHGSSAATERMLIDALPPGVRERVRYEGTVDDARKWLLLEQAELVLYPSVVEGFGMVPFEAASVGTATLVAPGSALGEVFEGTGAVVESWDERVWAERAIETIGDDAIADELAERIAARAERYSWSSVASATWAAIDDVLARPRARLHAEEGGWRSAVESDRLAVGTVGVHFLNRLEAAAARRLGLLTKWTKNDNERGSSS